MVAVIRKIYFILYTRKEEDCGYLLYQDGTAKKGELGKLELTCWREREGAINTTMTEEPRLRRVTDMEHEV